MCLISKKPYFYYPNKGMKNVLLKTSNPAAFPYSKDIKEIEQFLNKQGIRVFLEDVLISKKAASNINFCVILIDFEDENICKNAKKFIELNEEIKTFALIKNPTRKALLNADSIGCYSCINKIEDLDEDLIKPEHIKKEIKITDEFVGTKILIVDDIPENISILKDVLAPFKFDFTSYTNPKEALETIDEARYDLILLDVIMPEMDGFELADEIRSSEVNAQTPIIFVSASSEKQDKIEGFNFGSLAYIEKPIDPQTVIAQIYGILKVRKLNNQLLFEKENFIAMLTHDLKTPIRAQIQALDLLLKDYFGELNPRQREIVNEIMASNKYMQNMAENVLTNYKTENGKLKIQKTKNDIKATIENTVENLKFIISQKNQSIKVQYKDIDDTTAYYDDIEIKRVLSNLIVNASEYSFDNSTIDVAVEKIISEDSKSFKITVSDTGLGIQSNNIDSLFQKYSTNSKDYRKVGTGLGLYICRAIVNAHGGTIEAKRPKDKKGGMSFSFTINIETPALKQTDNTRIKPKEKQN